MIVDAHNDLLLELAFRAAEENPFARYWLSQLETGGLELQVCPVYVDLPYLPEGALREALRLVAAFRRAVRENEERVREVRSRADLANDGRLGLLLALEGADPLGYDLPLLDLFWELGVRMLQLTWNRRNFLADGAAEPEGGGRLSRVGRELVARCEELGIMLDLSHAAEATFFDVLERAPYAHVLVSHAACRALQPTPRNLSDDMLSALAERDGVLGMMMLPVVISYEQPTLDRLVDHVDHAVSVMGTRHVGLGSDFWRQVQHTLGLRPPPDALMQGGAFDAAIEGLEGPADLPKLVEVLRRRGYEGERLDAILRGNFLRLFEEALP